MNGYFLFDKDKFYEMWDEWYRTKADPRRVKNIDIYRVMGRFYVMVWWEILIFMAGMFSFGALTMLVVMWWLWQ